MGATPIWNLVIATSLSQLLMQTLTVNAPINLHCSQNQSLSQSPTVNRPLDEEECVQFLRNYNYRAISNVCNIKFNKQINGLKFQDNLNNKTNVTNVQNAPLFGQTINQIDTIIFLNFTVKISIYFSVAVNFEYYKT